MSKQNNDNKIVFLPKPQKVVVTESTTDDSHQTTEISETIQITTNVNTNTNNINDNQTESELSVSPRHRITLSSSSSESPTLEMQKEHQFVDINDDMNEEKSRENVNQNSNQIIIQNTNVIRIIKSARIIVCSYSTDIFSIYFVQFI